MFTMENLSKVMDAVQNEEDCVSLPEGVCGIIYGENYLGTYADVGCLLPVGVYAVIEDGECGEMSAIRIYTDQCW